VIAAKHGWVIAYDNLSSLPVWLSDALCCLTTGGGLGTRTLYLNDEEITFKCKRPVLLTGIEGVVKRPDLLGRTLTVECSAIERWMRKTEEELQRAFDRVHPLILGALLDAVSAALWNQGHFRPRELPRLADFSLWVTGAESQLGWPTGSMIAAIDINQASAVQIPLDDSVLVPTLRGILSEHPHQIEGTPAEVLKKMETWNAAYRWDHPNSKNWPTSAYELSGQLRRLAQSLETVGVKVTFDRLHERCIRLEGKFSDVTSESSSPIPLKLLRLQLQDENFQRRCEVTAVDAADTILIWHQAGLPITYSQEK
jgi:hypothetical protein